MANTLKDLVNIVRQLDQREPDGGWLFSEEYARLKSAIDFDELNVSLGLIEALLSELKQTRQRIVTQEIPAMMQSMDIDKCVIDGVQVKLDQEISLEAIDKEGTATTSPRILNWIRSIGDADLIKCTLTYPASEEGQVMDKLQGVTILNATSEAVNAATLKSLLKRRLENGESMPGPAVANLKTFVIAKLKEVNQ
jgi:hypothetical protein